MGACANRRKLQALPGVSLEKSVSCTQCSKECAGEGVKIMVAGVVEIRRPGTASSFRRVFCRLKKEDAPRGVEREK